MAFTSCDNIDMGLGYALIFLAFLLSIFNLQAYSQLDNTGKSNQAFQFSTALITLIVTIVYFLYMIKDPIASLFTKK